MYAMSRDGLVPPVFSKVSRRQTPALATALFGILIAVLAATVPLEIIFELVNIGTLFAFVIVNIGVIILRRTRPEMERGFRVPWVPVVPIIGALLCFYLMKQLTLETWLRFVLWLVAGLVIYFLYGRRRSKLQHGEVVVTEDV
jgi:APA family basic amino acid/polyamine antiporter